MSYRVLLITTLLGALFVTSAYGHAGHFHPTDLHISRSTHRNMQASIPPYLTIQTALANGRVDGSLHQAAKVMAQEAGKAAGTEQERTGRAMYEKMAKAAHKIAAAGNLQSARDAFTDLNNAMVPFFHTWTGHITEHGLTLFECKDGRAGWLQKGTAPEDPYRGIDGEKCSDLKVFKF